MNGSHVFALIPAAGKSTRMGRPKLALPLGQHTLLEHVIRTLKQAGLTDILVVLGPGGADLADKAAGADVLVLEKETPDMRATIEHGLAWLENRYRPRPEDYLLLLPADHPAVDAAVVRVLLAARDEHPDADIFVPTHAGRRGHPVLFGWNHVPSIRALPAGQGLNVYLRQQAWATREVPVTSAAVLHDVDTPEDYERLKEELSN